MLAWNTFWDAKSPVADTLAALEKIELTEAEAEDLAIKLRVLSEKVSELEAKQIEQARRDAENASSSARNNARR